MSKIKCTHCGNSRIKFDINYMLSVPVCST